METPQAGPNTAAPEPAAPELGSLVRLRELPPYLKTADAMPMLRPPDLVDAGEQGQVVALKALGQLAVRFRRGTFLLESRQLELVNGAS
jgi:hypothetical protein